MRKLASIQRITALFPIPGADKIEVAQIGGWTVVVKKGEFQVGDLVVYFEIDSFLPAAHPAFEFLAKDAKERNGVMRIRLKTIRLRKQLSQGLVIGLDQFPELSRSVIGLRPLAEGDDVSEILNVEKYEPPEDVHANGGPAEQRSRASQWPFFLQKTDQERVQNVLPQLERIAGDESFEVTIKLDGSSMTVYALSKTSPYFAEAFKKRAAKYEVTHLKCLSTFQTIKYWLGRLFGAPAATPEYVYGVCSRNIELDLDGDSHFAQYVREHGLIEKLQLQTGMKESFAFQGELIAPNIQGNYEKVGKPEWYVYDVYNIDAQSYKLPVVARRMTKQFGLDYVPVVSESFRIWNEGEELTGLAIANKALASAEGPGMNPEVRREGLVYKSNHTPFSFKAVSNSYLEAKG